MSIESAIKELQRKREALLAEKADLERQSKALDQDVAVLSRAINLIDPSVNEDKATSSTAREAIRAAFGKKEMNRAILDAVRAAGQPILAADVALAVAAIRLPNADPDVIKQLKADVSARLSLIAKNGTVERVPDGEHVRWRISVLDRHPNDLPRKLIPLPIAAKVP